MKNWLILGICYFGISSVTCAGQTCDSFSSFHFYPGNLHSHTIYTSSHGAQYDKLPGYDRYMVIDSKGVSKSVHTRLKKTGRNYRVFH